MNNRGTIRNLRPFKKGQSGNPRGRPSEVWREWLQRIEPEAQQVLEQLLRDKRLKPETRVRIAQDLLDRQHGRPKQEVEGRFEHPIVVFKDKDMDF